MKQSFTSKLLLSLCVISSCSGVDTQLQKDLELKVRSLSDELCEVISQWFSDNDTAEDNYKSIQELINNLAEQYDETLPQPHFLKLVLEKVSFGQYERPKGSLTPAAFQLLDDWLKQHSYKDIQMMHIILLAELVEATGDRKKALTLMMEHVKNTMKKRSTKTSGENR